MTRRGRIAGAPVAASVALLAGALLAVGCLTALEARARASGPATGPGLPPILSPHQLAALSGGFAPALADVAWIEAAATSAAELDGPAADRLYDLIDRVTTLDPTFQPAYPHGALLLSVAARRPDLSDRLLVKARAAFPEVWTFPFYQSFNAFYHRADFPEAARHMAAAARMPGAPPYLGALAERFADETRNRAVARELVERLLRVTRDPVIRQRLQERLRAMENAA